MYMPIQKALSAVAPTLVGDEAGSSPVLSALKKLPPSLEKNTLVGAVKAHLEDRIIVYDNKCVVFDT